MLSVEFKGLPSVVGRLGQAAKDLTRLKADSQFRAGNFGLILAKSKVPIESGETRDHITQINSGLETTILSVPAPSDLKSKTIVKRGKEFQDPGKPVNVLLDEGRIEELNWGSRLLPKTGEFGFMEKTVDPTREEFIRLLNVGIQKVTQ